MIRQKRLIIVSELTEVIDNLTGELERFREMHAETLIEHAKERDRWAAQLSTARVLLTKLEAHIRDAREMFHVLRNDKGRDDQGLDMKHKTYDRNRRRVEPLR